MKITGHIGKRKTSDIGSNSMLDRRDFLSTLVLGTAAITITPCDLQAVDGLSGAKRPNIILVLSDDHGFPHVGCYGNPDIKTPNLDKFASQGMRFDRAYVMCPQCVPSRATIMTGRSPVRIAMTRFSAPLPMDVRTYPEVLRTNGYFTGVAGRTYHLDGGARTPEMNEFFDKHELRTFEKRVDFCKTASGGPAILEQYREFLDTVPKNKPFFLQLCFNDPHRPLDKNAIPQPHDPVKLKLPAHYPDTQLIREDFARYYDEISRFDSDFGKVMEELEKRGLAQNTIVAFMGDNGCSQFRGKGTLYEFGIHVPLLVRWPGIVKAEATTDVLVSAEDLAPTFLEVAGLKPLPEMTGVSFAKLLCSEPFEGRKYVFAERGAHGSGGLPQNSAAFDLSRCVVSKTHKFIYNALWQIPYTPVDFNGDQFWKELEEMNASGKLSPEISRIYFSPTRPMIELYDLEKDPREFENLAGKPEFAGIEHELKWALTEWMIMERDFLPLPVPAGAKAGRKNKAKGKK
ncbi:MAG: sulfatase [Kiritimatiellae bacterium]|nr:sulfatase [Kiritimatiellia bacterium]MDD5519894.1 sulfatase [Kiritimatiellia bacterium]